jgi:hypothetical protein
MDISTIITIISVLIAAGALFVSASALMGTRKTDFSNMIKQQERQSLLTEQLVSENREISKGVASLAESYNLFLNRVIVIEESLKSAWKRIDELVTFTGMIDGKK